MREKKGQLTIFVIIAILVVFVIVGYFFIRDDSLKESYVSDEIRPVYDVVLDCARGVSEESIVVIGESGGYFVLPNNSNSFNIAYYFYEGEGFMPSVEDIESEIESYVESMLFFCAKKNALDLSGSDVNFGEVDVDVNILDDDKVYFNIDFPFSIVKNNRSFYFDEPFEFVYDVRLYSILFFASEIVKWHEKEPRAFCFSCAGELGFDLGLGIDLWKSASNEVTFYISDYDAEINGRDYMYFFVIKYPENNNYDPFEGIFY